MQSVGILCSWYCYDIALFNVAYFPPLCLGKESVLPRAIDHHRHHRRQQADGGGSGVQDEVSHRHHGSG